MFAKVIVEDGVFDLQDIPRILEEKRQIIRKTGLLEYYDLTEDLGSVGGLSALKDWLASRSGAFSSRAREFGLPEPKGLLLLGVQGCGKSLSAKAIAGLWHLPLLRLDVGAVMNAFVGSSEENMRKAIRIAESLSPCILWLDEIEKGFSGMGGRNDADGGVSRRVFATFLTWLQEKTRPVFVIATANSIEMLPPEMLRKGRFDEIFFVDLPAAAEREAIFRIHLRKRDRDPARFDPPRLAEAAEGFSGAEIEQAIISALYDAFDDGGREVTQADLDGAIRQTIPLSRTMDQEIDGLRDWAHERTRPASSAQG